MTPVLNSGDHEVPNNNRPISLLPVLSKVCERAAFNQFTTYLVSKEPLTSKKSGNKQHHSTETTRIHTTDLLRATDDKQLTATVLLDMSKAFDSLHHGALLAKLQDVGASTTALQWFRSYLSSCHQVVRINSTLSDCMRVRNGVPQGSILSPLLFSIHVNDLPSIPQFCFPQCYVDDTKLLLSFALNEERGARDKINQDLLKIRNWCFNNQLLLNQDKMKLMIFGSRQNIAKVNDDFNLSLFGKDLVPATTAKDLGVIMDPNLTFGNHILETVSSYMSRLAQINRVKHSFDKQSLIIIINSLVFSKLFYCSCVWSNTSQTNLKMLQTVQNFTCRIEIRSRVSNFKGNTLAASEGASLLP